MATRFDFIKAIIRPTHNTDYVQECVSADYDNEQRLFAYTALTDRFTLPKRKKLNFDTEFG
jgi:hypothetical protein